MNLPDGLLHIRIARYHNIFGPEGAWNDGKEKAPAAICRKVAMAPDGGSVEIWGDGEQSRSFLFIEECLRGTTRLTSWTATSGHHKVEYTVASQTHVISESGSDRSGTAPTLKHLNLGS